MVFILIVRRVGLGRSGGTNHEDNHHEIDNCRCCLGGGNVFRRSRQPCFWGRPVVLGEKRWGQRVLGLPIPHVRSMLSERAGRSRGLLLEPVAGPDYSDHSGIPAGSKTVRAAALTVRSPPIGRPQQPAVTARRRLLNRCNLCPLMALSGRSERSCRCPLSGVKRTRTSPVVAAAFDPKRTSNQTEPPLDIVLALEDGWCLSLNLDVSQ